MRSFVGRLSAFRLSAYVGAVHIANRGLSLLIGILLARVLGAEGYGIYAYAFAFMGLLMIPAQWGIPTFLLREVAKARSLQHWERLSGYIKRGPLVVAALACSVSALSYLLFLFLGQSEESTQRSALFLALILLPLAAVLITQCDILRALEANALGQLFHQVVGQALALFAFVMLVVVFPGSLTVLMALTVQIVAIGVVLAIITVVIIDHHPDEIKTISLVQDWRRWLRQSTPFVLIASALLLNTRIDVIMIGWFKDATDVGVYNVAVQGGILISVGVQVVGSAYAPRFAQHFVQGEVRELRSLYRGAQAISVCTAGIVLGVFYLFGEVLLVQVFGPAFGASYLPLIILSLGYLSNAAFGPIGALSMMVGKEKLTAQVFWVTGVLNVGLNALLIPIYGPVGAAAATATALFSYHFILYVVLWRYIS